MKWFSIEADDPDIVVAWRAPRWEWPDILDSFKMSFSGHAEFDGDSKTWRLPRSRYASVRAWATRFFDAGQIRDECEPRRQTSYAPAPSPLAQAYRALWLVPGAPDWAITAMARAATKVHHPDAGGDHAAMVAVNRAVEILRQAGAMQ